MAEEFEPITSQEALDSLITARIEENTKTVTESVTKQFEGYISPDDLAAKTGELKNTISDLTTKNKAYENSNLKLKAAHEFGIPFELSDRISGDDEKAIREDAERLSKFLAPKNAAPNFDPETPPAKNSTDAALRKTLEKLKGE